MDGETQKRVKGFNSMKCSSSEIEIEVLLHRIKENDINLQPDFQRGEVWTTQKKRKLIDSIFRGWKIPPIHVIENTNYVDEVLDGQQRLAAIRDFYNDGIIIDGKILPEDPDITKLDGYVYSQLDIDLQRKFRKYNIIVIRLTEYNPEEPAELFNRLNQPATLTSAEKRNAYSGKTRDQIRDLVNYFESIGADKYSIGFSNSRMAYDEVLSKFCYTLEVNTLKKKITTNDLTEKYRLDYTFSTNIINEAKSALELLLKSIIHQQNNQFRIFTINKATLYSWLLFIVKNKKNIALESLGRIIFGFENTRLYAKGKSQLDLFYYEFDKMKEIQSIYPFYQSMFLLFNQKASMGSTDATSIISRDIILELYRMIHFESNNESLQWFTYEFNQSNNLPNCIEKFEEKYNWGSQIL